MRLITAVGGVLMALTTPITTTAEEVSQSQSQSQSKSQSQALPSCTEKYALQSTKSSEDFLTSILNPITINDFFENHFQKKAASSQRPGMPGYYGPMVSFEDVEYAMENGFKVSNPNKRLIYGKDWKLAKRVYRDDEYWTGIYSSEEEEMSVEEAMRAVSQGFTVIMNGVQSCMPNVYQSAWQLETALGYHVNVNLYISPQGGSQGFEAHLDWMDGFIFQITGQKVSVCLYMYQCRSLIV
jgi:ribosomal protein L16 Arg81 hydroxylase